MFSLRRIIIPRQQQQQQSIWTVAHNYLHYIGKCRLDNAATAAPAVGGGGDARSACRILDRGGCIRSFRADGGGGDWGQSRSRRRTHRDSDRNNNDNNQKGPSHGYKFTGSGEVTNKDVEQKINELIINRCQARKERNFEMADTIRATLQHQYGVWLDDREMRWSLINENDTTHNNNDTSYTLSPDAGPLQSPLSEEEIHALLVKRLKCKRNRNFQDADTLHAKLQAANVAIDDKKREWRADGVRYFNQDKVFHYVESKYSQRETTTTTTGNDNDDDNNDTREIEIEIGRLVEQRQKFRKLQLFSQADAVLHELKEQYNVTVEDNLKEWSVGGRFAPSRKQHDKYVMSPTSEPIDDADQMIQIQSLVEERNDYRRVKDYNRADQVQARLRNEYSVLVDDVTAEWSVMTRTRSSSRSSSSKKRDFQQKHQAVVPTRYVRKGDGVFSTKEDEATVLRLVQERSLFKAKRNFTQADKLRTQLLEDFHVRVDDDEKVWYLVTDKKLYFMVNPPSEISSETRAFVEQRLADRTIAKLRRKFDVADAILDELESTYGVRVNDHRMEWKILLKESSSSSSSG